ncbi:MAG: hypothetical protein A2Z39_02385 [Deltaproteobacteria bacterium RBG_19FT_COMBO_46_9]|jgi:acetyltransferase-like isoleucine patch superfamily enzyme|nr:MAG: hypothetical protein A2Z39_02385 [Deltaproteobacteria bacterium RBG_19FT_COMBO_46_9]
MLIQKDRFPIKDVILFGFLPNFIRKWIYRLKGYRIGKKVSFGIGAVICGEEVSIGDHTTIGFFTIIRGKKIKIGSFVNIGATTILDTPYLEIGDGSRINEQVFVGGLQFPDSKLVIGKNCQIMQMSFLNPAKAITIGDDSGIGGHCLLFGHTSWLSCFEGYPVEFEPIEIGKSVSLAWRVFVLPGTKIGDGAVIGANSLVYRTIPPKCLAVGFPARVVSKFPEFPKDVSAEEKANLLHGIINEMIEVFKGSGLECQVVGENIFEITKTTNNLWGQKAKRFRLKVFYQGISPNEVPSTEDKINVILSLRAIPGNLREAYNKRGVMWIDIEKKEQPLFLNDLGEEVLLFLKRYGVRLFRVET